MKITNDLLLERMQWMENKQFSENTIDRYFTNFKLFIERWNRNIGTTMSSENLRLAEIEKRKTVLNKTLAGKTSIYYAKGTTLSQQTIQGKLVAIKSFLKYLNYYYDAGIDYRKIEIKKCKSDYIESLTEAEFNTFMEFIDHHEKYRINSLRSQLLCNIAYTSWLRLSEMLSLTIDDVRKKEIRITWKWNKTRRVFFTPSTENILEMYLYERWKPLPWTWNVEKRSNYVFISHNPWYEFWTPIRKNTACDKIKKYSDEIKLGKRVTIHSLRHSYATRLLENWLNIREIQELMWHCDIQTTENYLHVLKSNLQKKVNQIFT